LEPFDFGLLGANPVVVAGSPATALETLNVVFAFLNAFKNKMDLMFKEPCNLVVAILDLASQFVDLALKGANLLLLVRLVRSKQIQLRQQVVLPTKPLSLFAQLRYQEVLFIVASALACALATAIVVWRVVLRLRHDDSDCTVREHVARLLDAISKTAGLSKATRAADADDNDGGWGGLFDLLRADPSSPSVDSQAHTNRLNES
jgi:hypothetical protein